MQTSNRNVSAQLNCFGLGEYLCLYLENGKSFLFTFCIPLFALSKGSPEQNKPTLRHLLLFSFFHSFGNHVWGPGHLPSLPIPKATTVVDLYSISLSSHTQDLCLALSNKSNVDIKL